MTPPPLLRRLMEIVSPGDAATVRSTIVSACWNDRVDWVGLACRGFGMTGLPVGMTIGATTASGAGSDSVIGGALGSTGISRIDVKGTATSIAAEPMAA